MHRARKIRVRDLNPQLTCKLCKGYFVDATTVIECLHSFCRSCIVRYLQKNKYCPTCDVQVHKTKPLLNVRPDRILQDVVYKLVPRLYQNEMQRRKEFGVSHPETRPEEVSHQHLLTPDETICLALSYHGNLGTLRYLRCPAAVSVVHLEKLIRAKYDLTCHHRVDILYEQDTLSCHLSLMDIAYIYSWRRKGPLELTFRIYENVSLTETVAEETKKTEEEHPNNNNNNNNNDWKEVQLRISENGEMSITGIQDEPPKPTPPAVVCSNGLSLNSAGSITTTVTACDTVVSASSETRKKHKLEERKSDEEPPQKQKILNHTLGLQHLSNNHPLKKHSQAVRSVENGNKVTPVRWPPPKLSPNVPCYVPKTTCGPIVNVPTMVSKTQTVTTNANVSVKMATKTKPSCPIGYKTLRDPPKTWNPQIPRPNKSNETDAKSERPAKFFKMRNNMPRYLGNPASGVKPMYQVHTSPEIKRQSIVKVDPKTLKPMAAAEKAPDLKISPVPIFNPRKSPHSPPKTTKTNLNFTPPNPFVPNLSSPTVSPNHFLYPSGPPGFPPYDPRLMAAYHSLLYGQRVPFSPLTLELPSPTGSKVGVQSSSGAGSPKLKKSGGKETKSLQNAVEKLTQSRIAKSEENIKKEGLEEEVVKKEQVEEQKDVKKATTDTTDGKDGKSTSPSSDTK